MRCILVIGTSGSGKTTVARELSSIIQVPAYDLDDYYWLPGWQPRPIEEFQLSVNSLISKKSWIISGNYSSVRETIWQRADTIIWLDYSFLRCLHQCFRRSTLRVRRRQLCCNGNYESLHRTFLSKDSILWWIVKSYWRHKKTYKELFQHNRDSNKGYLRFFSPCVTRFWLKNIKLEKLK